MRLGDASVKTMHMGQIKQAWHARRPADAYSRFILKPDQRHQHQSLQAGSCRLISYSAIPALQRSLRLAPWTLQETQRPSELQLQNGSVTLAMVSPDFWTSLSGSLHTMFLQNIVPLQYKREAHLPKQLQMCYRCWGHAAWAVVLVDASLWSSDCLPDSISLLSFLCNVHEALSSLPPVRSLQWGTHILMFQIHCQLGVSDLVSRFPLQSSQVDAMHVIWLE